MEDLVDGRPGQRGVEVAVSGLVSSGVAPPAVSEVADTSRPKRRTNFAFLLNPYSVGNGKPVARDRPRPGQLFRLSLGLMSRSKVTPLMREYTKVRTQYQSSQRICI